MNWRILMAMGVLSAAACSGGNSDDTSSEVEAVDSDNDGLTDIEEEELGSDPNLADTDGDGLSDGEEVGLDLDPNSVDSDGDGYRDGDEVMEGKDPADANSVIYKGGWPYNASKADIDESDVPSTLKVGDLFVHFTAKDQFTDTVDVWDFKNDEDKYIIVDISAQWCGPCNQMAAWMDGDVPAFDSYFPGIREAVDNGDAYWITVLGEMNSGATAKQKTTEQWYEEYPNPHIPILADTDYTTANFVELSYWPTVIVLNSDLTVAWAPKGNDGWDGAMYFMMDNL